MRLNKAKLKHEGIHFVAGVVVFFGVFPLAFHGFQAIVEGPCIPPRTGMQRGDGAIERPP